MSEDQYGRVIPMHRIEKWQRGCWYGAALLTCPAHEVEGSDTIERYPEQWMFVVWRPMDYALPFWRPDAWGHTVGPPWSAMADATEGAPTLMLEAEHCLWSAWLEIPLSCETIAPWYASQLRRRREEQRAAERLRYRQWYRSDVESFQSFIGQVLARTPADPNPSPLGSSLNPLSKAPVRPRWVPVKPTRSAPDPSRMRWPLGPGHEGVWALGADGSLDLERIDGFGWPFERYRIKANAVPSLCEALAREYGVLVPGWKETFAVARRGFDGWHNFIEWLLKSSVPVERGTPGLSPNQPPGKEGES